MASRVISSVPEGEHQLRTRGTPWIAPFLERLPFKRKLLSVPPQKREKLKRTPLKRESKGHKAEMRKYNESAPAFFAEPGNDVCRICVVLREAGDNILLQPATERHHLRGRIGRLLNWRPGQIPSCYGHRSWPHDHPARARKLGLLCAPAQWNIFPGDGD
jgi:hypothetical protein